MNKVIELLGTVKSNKNLTNYVDTAEGRVYLGKVSGFKAGDSIMGSAVCKEQDVTYPAQAAVGTPGQPGYRAATTETVEKGWSCVNFISEEMQTKQLEAQARKAKAKLQIAIVDRQASEVLTMETADLWTIPA